MRTLEIDSTSKHRKNFSSNWINKREELVYGSMIVLFINVFFHRENTLLVNAEHLFGCSVLCLWLHVVFATITHEK